MDEGDGVGVGVGVTGVGVLSVNVHPSGQEVLSWLAMSAKMVAQSAPG